MIQFRFRRSYIQLYPVAHKCIWAPCAQLYSLAETPQTPALPPRLCSYKRALLVSQDRRHLFVTPFNARIDYIPPVRDLEFSLWSLP